MSAKDDVLQTLYAARDRLADLIVLWSPDPAANVETRKQQAADLHALVAQRDEVNARINGIIAAAFRNVASSERRWASAELGSLTEKLQNFGKTVADVNEVLKIADQVVAAASKVIKVAKALI